MENHKQHISDLRKLALDMKDIVKRKEDFGEQYQHIKKLITRIRTDQQNIRNWDKLNKRFQKISSISVSSFLDELEATLRILDRLEEIDSFFAELCDCVGSTDLDDAKFICTLANTPKSLAAAVKMLSNYQKNVLDIEKLYYKHFYSLRSMPKNNTIDSIINKLNSRYKKSGWWLFIKPFVSTFVLSLILLVQLLIIDPEEFLFSLPALLVMPIAWGGVALIVDFCTEERHWDRTIWDYIIIVFCATIYYIFFVPFFKISFVQKRKIYKKIKTPHTNVFHSDLLSILKRASELLGKMNDDSGIEYNDTVAKIGWRFWECNSIEEATQKYLDDIKGTFEYTELDRKYGQLDSSSSSSSYSSRNKSYDYDSSSYSGGSSSYNSSSSSTRERTFEEIQGIPQSNLLDQKMKDLAYSKGTVVIYKNYYGHWTAADSASTYSVYEGYDSSIKKRYFEFNGKKHYHGDTYPDPDKIYYFS